MAQRGLSASSWYNDLLKESHKHDAPPHTLRRKREPRKPINAHTPPPKGDKARMEQVCRIVDIYRQNWLTPMNAVSVLKDILKG